MAQSTEQMRRDLEALRQECARLKAWKRNSPRLLFWRYQTLSALRW